MKPMTATVELLWIPLGAGQHVVRLSGRAFEAISAVIQHRHPSDLYHSALVVTFPRRSLCHRDDTDPRPTRRSTGCSRRRSRRLEVAGQTKAVPVRDPPMVRRCHPGRRSRGRDDDLEPRPRRRKTTPCRRAKRAHTGVGQRRTWRRRDVELELGHVMDPSTRRYRHRAHRTAHRWPSTWVERRASRRKPLGAP